MEIQWSLNESLSLSTSLYPTNPTNSSNSMFCHIVMAPNTGLDPASV